MQKRQKRASDKRLKLITAGASLFHTQGYKATSLAEVAKAAGVPAGGVFYHFPSKAALADAVMAHHDAYFADSLTRIEATSEDPRQRLRLFWDGAETLAQARAEHGCPVLALAGDMAADPARRTQDQQQRALVMRNTISWLSRQYAALGLDDNAAQLAAAALFAAMQGAFAVGHVLGDADLIRQLFDETRKQQQKAGYL